MKTKKEIILAKIEENKSLIKRINSINHFNTEDFYNHSIRYIKAIKQGRMCCVITSVSSSGMSMNLKFLECSGSLNKGFRYCHFNMIFVALGFSKVGETGTFRINGGGMDMVFDTNYTIIHDLTSLGFLSKKECDILAQQTPIIL